MTVQVSARSALGQEVARAHPARSLSQIATAYGLTRGQVAGLVNRVNRGYVKRHPPAQRPQRESTFATPLLALLADGRPRTTNEIQDRLGCGKSTLARLLRSYEAEGLITRLEPSRGNNPAIWIENEEEPA